MERLLDKYDEILGLDVPAVLEKHSDVMAPEVLECLNATKDKLAAFDYDFEAGEIEEARQRVAIWDYKKEIEATLLPAKKGLGAGQTSPEINASLAAAEKMRPVLADMEREHSRIASELVRTREIKDKLDADMRLLMERMASDRVRAIGGNKDNVRSVAGEGGWGAKNRVY